MYKKCIFRVGRNNATIPINLRIYTFGTIKRIHCIKKTLSIAWHSIIFSPKAGRVSVYLLTAWSFLYEEGSD